MKKLCFVTGILAMFLIFGCAKFDPESVAKDYVKDQFKSEQPIKVDTSGLKYKVVEKSDTHAIVEVYGTIDFQGKVRLVKTGKKWEVSEEEAVPVQPDIVH